MHPCLAECEAESAVPGPELVTAGETLPDAVAEDKDSINGVQQLSQEATGIIQSFTQQVTLGAAQLAPWLVQDACQGVWVAPRMVAARACCGKLHVPRHATSIASAEIKGRSNDARVKPLASQSRRWRGGGLGFGLVVKNPLRFQSSSLYAQSSAV